MSIDENLLYEGVRPDNVYRFIQTIAEHKGDGPIKYHKDKVAVSVSSNSMQENAQDIEALHAEVIALKKQLNESRDIEALHAEVIALKKQLNESRDIEALHAEVIALKKQLNESRKELCSTQSTLKEATNKAHVFKTQRDFAQNKGTYYKGVQNVLLEDLVENEEEYSIRRDGYSRIRVYCK